MLYISQLRVLLSFDVYPALVRAEIMIVILAPLGLHVLDRLRQRSQVLILVIPSGVLVVLILHTEIVRDDYDPVIQKLLKNKVRVLFDIRHIIKLGFQALLIEPAYPSGNPLEEELRIKLPYVSRHGAGSESQPQVAENLGDPFKLHVDDVLILYLHFVILALIDHL